MEFTPFDSNLTQFPAKGDNLMICSPAGRILYLTESLQSQLNEELVGRPLTELLPDSLAAQLIAAAHSGQNHSFQTSLRGRHAQCKMEPWEGLVVIVVLFTEEQIKPAMSLNAAELLHREINSNLATMLVAWDSLPIAHSVDGQFAKNVLRQGMYRMIRLSRNVVDCARAENGHLKLNLQQQDLIDFCQQLLQQAAPLLEELEIPLTWELPSQPLPCLFDQEMLKRVLLNLLTNCAKYTRQDNQINLSLIVKEKTAVISVIDQGAGIPSGLLPYVFTRRQENAVSTTMMPGGAGYGLSLAKAVMALHGGACVISSTEGQGTTVTLTLPLKQGVSTPPMPLATTAVDYASSYDPLLLELSPVLSYKHYGKPKQKK